MQYKNYDKLMEYINSHPELNAEVQFGTLADYFNSVNADSKSLSLIEKKDSEHFFPTLSGDFFTYADRDDHYWSGMYLLDTFQDFLFELDMKPFMHASSGNKHFFTTLSHHQTHQNYEQS